MTLVKKWGFGVRKEDRKDAVALRPTVREPTNGWNLGNRLILVYAETGGVGKKRTSIALRL
jgi:hypothetical protein